MRRHTGAANSGQAEPNSTAGGAEHSRAAPPRADRCRSAIRCIALGERVDHHRDAQSTREQHGDRDKVAPKRCRRHVLGNVLLMGDRGTAAPDRPNLSSRHQVAGDGVAAPTSRAAPSPTRTRPAFWPTNVSGVMCGRRHLRERHRLQQRGKRMMIAVFTSPAPPSSRRSAPPITKPPTRAANSTRVPESLARGG